MKSPVTIGYLSRICPEKGLHQLAEAFRLLAGEKDLPAVRLLAAGYMAERLGEVLADALKDLGLVDDEQYAHG